MNTTQQPFAIQPQRRKLTMTLFAAASGLAGSGVRAQQNKPELSAPPPGNKDQIVALVRTFKGTVRKVQDIKPMTGMTAQGIPVSADQLPLIDTFVGDLDIRYAFDSDSGFRYLTERDLKPLNLTRAQLLPLAVANYRKLYPKLSIEKPAAFIGMLANGGELEPSVMLDTDFWEKQKSAYGGEIIAAAPARDVLWFTGAKPADNINNLRANTERVHKESGERALSRLLYAWRNKRWELLG